MSLSAVERPVFIFGQKLCVGTFRAVWKGAEDLPLSNGGRRTELEEGSIGDQAMGLCRYLYIMVSAMDSKFQLTMVTGLFLLMDGSTGTI